MHLSASEGASSMLARLQVAWHLAPASGGAGEGTEGQVLLGFHSEVLVEI